MNQLTNKLLRGIRTALAAGGRGGRLPPDLTEADRRIVEAVLPYTMTGVERIVAVIEATRHICANGVPGAIVECGVWRGGSAMTAALTLSSMADTGRDIYLYDTYTGMSEPTAEDVSHDGVSAAAQFEAAKAEQAGWCEASLEDVRQNLSRTAYPPSRLHFVKGKVEDTIPAVAPAQIALLRLDTDWYDSTRHELEQLFPRLHPRGVLIVDDYGHWRGARKAVDEYFSATRSRYYFHRIDYTGRCIVRIHD